MERCDHLSGTGWTLRYDDALFPPGTDSFALSAFPRLKPGSRVCDLGAGVGLLGLLLLRRELELRITGLELSAEALALAERNAAENGLRDRLRFLRADLRDGPALPDRGRWDLVICNPPYFPAGSGVSASGEGRRGAREEVSCSLEDACRAAGQLLRWGGSFCLVHRPERLADLLTALRAAGTEAKRLRPVCRAAETAPSLLLAEGRRGGRPGLVWEPPLILQNPDGTPTAEADRIYFRQEDSL